MWESKIKTVENCGMVSDTFEIFIAPKAKIKIDLLMSLFPDTEWLAYLTGEGNLIEDIVIPEQEVTSSTVTVIEFPKDVETIGVIHSHHGMGSFFSGTDNDYINSNHNISICVSHEEMTGVSRIKTPCGALKTVPLSIVFHYNVELNVEEFLNEVDTNIIPDDFFGKNEDDDDFGIDDEFEFEDDFDIDDEEEMRESIKRNIIKDTLHYNQRQ